MNESAKNKKQAFTMTVVQTIGGLAAILMIAYFMGGYDYVKKYLPKQTASNSDVEPRSSGQPPIRRTPGPPNNGSFASQTPLTSNGMMVGEVTASSALIQTRLTKDEVLRDGDSEGAEGFVRFVLEPVIILGDAGVRERRARMRVAESAKQTKEVWAKADHDFIARVAFWDLEPNTSYQCSAWIGKTNERTRLGPIVTFHTLPGSEVATKQSVAVVTGMNYAKYYGDEPAEGNDNSDDDAEPVKGEALNRSLGYPAIVSIALLTPDYFVGTGDNVYYDRPAKPRAETIEAMRKKWHQQFFQTRFHELFSHVPTYWEVDDHDYRIDDCDNTGDYAPSPELAQKVLFEQLPMLYMPIDDSVEGESEIVGVDSASNKSYRTQRITKDLQIWLTDNRLYRSPNKMEDGPEKSIWGAEQREWLKQTLAESDATFKVLISPTPLIGPDDLRKKDNHTNIGGFQHERDEFFLWLKDAKLDQNNFFIVCGDRHWQYHSIHPSGFEEFSCGALVDANARLGRNPGDPKSTDPEGLIKQPYTQKPASGGFLIFTIEPAEGEQPAQLKFDFYNEQGELLYQARKRVTTNDAG